MSDIKKQIVDAEFKMMERAVEATEQKQSVVPFDENLLEKSRTQWQFGQWNTLLKLDRVTIQHHPDRAKLALFVASAKLVNGYFNEAVQYLQWAKDLGVEKNTLLRIILASSHNTLGRLAYLVNQKERALSHFESAIKSVSPGVDAKLFARARLDSEFQLLDKSTNESVSAPQENLPKQHDATLSDASYQFYLNMRIESGTAYPLGFNANGPVVFTVSEQDLSYEIHDKKPLYFVTSESGSFEKPSSSSQISLLPNNAYVLSGELIHHGDDLPILWVFQYAEGKRLESTNQRIDAKGRFKIDLKISSLTESVALGIRVSGNGRLDLSSSYLNIRKYSGTDALESIDEKINDLKSLQKQEVQKSMQQIEAAMRLQNYLGSDVFLPDMHGWAISPDFGVLLINQIEQNEYDAIIEFGSGTSTILIAKVLQKQRARKKSTTKFVSFDHLEEYFKKTAKLLTQAGLHEECVLIYTPLVEWLNAENQIYRFYDCQNALNDMNLDYQDEQPKILVVVDGPPASTGKHARYPAMFNVLQSFSKTEADVDFLLDDYCRDDEKEIVSLWKAWLTEHRYQSTIVEFKKLEKQACLVQTKLTYLES